MLLTFPPCLPSISKFPSPVCPIQLHLCIKPADKTEACKAANCCPIQLGDAQLFSLAFKLFPRVPDREALLPALEAPGGERSPQPHCSAPPCPLSLLRAQPLPSPLGRSPSRSPYLLTHCGQSRCLICLKLPFLHFVISFLGLLT